MRIVRILILAHTAQRAMDLADSRGYRAENARIFLDPGEAAEAFLKDPYAAVIIDPELADRSVPLLHAAYGAGARVIWSAGTAGSSFRRALRWAERRNDDPAPGTSREPGP